MSNQTSPITPRLGKDDKLTRVMIYTSHSMVWGQALSKKAIRINTWLYSDMAPTYMKIYNAQLLVVGGSGSSTPVKYPTLQMQISAINAFHLMPPFSEGVDFDPDEPNRKFVPITAHVGYFRFEGSVRMADLTTMDNFLGAAKGEYISIYDITMTCPLMPAIKGIQAPMAILRQDHVSFAANES